MKKNNRDISLFRFSIIAPIINNTHGFSTKTAYIDFITSKIHHYDGKDYKLTPSCIYRWVNLYRKEGITALENKTRSDYKSSRKLTPNVVEKIKEIREQYPNITGTAMYKKMIKEQILNQKDITLNAFLRFIKNNNLKANQLTNIERRMFEMKYSNDCWQGDSSVGPYIKINNIKYKTYIIMLVDDKSRMIMGYDIFFNDTAINMQKVFKTAVETYGIPKKLFVDNGGPYSNKQLSYICASLGVELIHAKPYSPESKAKQERLFRTIKDGWMRAIDWNSFKSLDDVKKSLEKFLRENYINKKHSTTKETPNDRWHEDFDLIKYKSEEEIKEAFLHRTTKKVRLDRTIRFNNEYYEVPYKYVGQTIELRYNPNNLEILYLYEDNKFIEEIRMVDKIANGKSKRTNNIDYSKMINDERDVIEKESEYV